jgi:hypothetical protein
MRSSLRIRIPRRSLLLASATVAVGVALSATAPNAAACIQCISESSEAYVFCQHHPNGTEYMGCNFNVTCGPLTKSAMEIYDVECVG